MTASTLDAAEIGVVSATAIREIAQRAIAGQPIATYAHSAPLAWAAIGGTAEEGLTPVGDGGVPVARAIGTTSDFLDQPQSWVPDDFAPTLRLVVLPWATAIDPVAARELAVLWAAECVGAAQHLVRVSVAYAKEREQFGRPIGSFQAIKHRLADMHSMAEYADTAVVWSSHEPHNAVRPVLYALDKSILVAQSAVQVHGGMGFTWEMGLHFYLRSMLMRRELVQGLFR